MRGYILVSGSIFGVVALVHAQRVLAPWTIVIAGWNVPQWVSLAGVVVAGTLCAWAIRLFLRSKH